MSKKQVKTQQPETVKPRPEHPRESIPRLEVQLHETKGQLARAKRLQKLQGMADKLGLFHGICRAINNSRGRTVLAFRIDEHRDCHHRPAREWDWRGLVNVSIDREYPAAAAAEDLRRIAAELEKDGEGLMAMAERHDASYGEDLEWELFPESAPNPAPEPDPDIPF